MQAQPYTLQENDIKGLTPKDLKAKVEAYRVLYGREPRILIEGNWYGPIDGKEFPDFSIHSRFGLLSVEKIGAKYLTVGNGKWSHQVMLNEELGGATKVIFDGT